MRFFALCALLLLCPIIFVGCGDDDNPVKQQEEPSPYALSIVRPDWHHAPPPATLPPGAAAGRLLWHSSPEAYDVVSVFGYPAMAGEASFRPLRLIFRPVDAPSPVDSFLQAHGVTPPTSPPVNAPSWAGIILPKEMTIAPDFGLLAKATGGLLHIEFGQFRMDLNNDGILQTEDLDGNFALTEEEDVGLDLLSDFYEPRYSSQNNADPNNDNWYFLGEGACPVPPPLCDVLADQLNYLYTTHPLYCEWLNGTEGNRMDIASVGRPDDELIGPTPISYDAYFSYTIDLSVQPPGSEWHWWGFDLRDLNAIDTIIGTPSWDNIDFVRVWLEAPAGKSTEDTVWIAQWGFE